MLSSVKLNEDRVIIIFIFMHPKPQPIHKVEMIGDARKNRNS